MSALLAWFLSNPTILAIGAGIIAVAGAWLIQPRPDFMAMDHANGRPRYTEPFCYLVLRQYSLKGFNFSDIRLSEFCGAILFSLRMSAMLDPVGAIFNRCLPRQMPLGDAGEMPFAARMRSFVVGRRWRPMLFLADKAGDKLHPTIVFDAAVALGCGKRPRQALVTVVGEHDLFEVFSRLPSRGLRATSKWISMLTPAVVVRIAPATPQLVALAAIWNRAYWGNSHVELQCFRGQNPLTALVTLGGFAFCTALFLALQGMQQ
ncbi:hypothetical protein [Mesorhizobium sp.]|uniref:hypothetical protein n=1 Tax=Mesorhizobium sp. TaxID=1871066 RepID=UPI000FE9DE5C|nr:hypothetical protein [Mesorhizobium sp.]RWN33418.1 MAG: hypothetical protein EOR95_15840 [Mesorhizobium sp.]